MSTDQRIIKGVPIDCFFPWTHQSTKWKTISEGKIVDYAERTIGYYVNQRKENVLNVGKLRLIENDTIYNHDKF